jgi:multicomponent K+:H+ antiporter subunit G
MTPADALSPWVAVPVALLLFVGGSMVVTGALGLFRLPEFYQRVHGPAITITLGTGCVLIASMIYFSALASRPVLHELLITAFVLLTAPVVSMMITRAAVYRDMRAQAADKVESRQD